MKDLIDVYDIWMPVKEGGEAFHYQKQQNLKLIARIVNGVPITLEEDFVFERRNITKEESNNLISNHAKEKD